MDIKEQLKIIISAADDKRAENIVVLDISEVSQLTDFFVIMDAGSNRQVRAITENIQDVMSENNVNYKNVEGLDQADWVLLDYLNIMVHIFDRESREFYQLERLWSDAKLVDVKELID